MKGNPVLYKTLVVGVIILFIGLAIQPSVAVQQEIEIDIDPKDYLFQTIIDIANNPDVKELFEQYKPDMFKFDIDRSIYRKLFLRNPRLIINMLFTKPSFTFEYLDKTYKKGIEIIKILGEEKVFGIIESFRMNNSEFIDELNIIIPNNEELSNKIGTLKEMNKDSKPNLPFIDHPIICGILYIITFAICVLIGIEFILSIIFFGLFYLFSAFIFLIQDVTIILSFIIGGLISLLGCKLS